MPEGRMRIVQRGAAAPVVLAVNEAPKQPMTVYYRPDTWSGSCGITYRVAGGDWLSKWVRMEPIMGGWYRYTIPDTQGKSVSMAFTDNGSTWDNNNGKNYEVQDTSVSIHAGAMIAGTTPTALVTTNPVGWSYRYRNYDEEHNPYTPFRITDGCELGGWGYLHIA